MEFHGCQGISVGLPPLRTPLRHSHTVGMRYGGYLAFLPLYLVLASASAQDPPLGSSCPITATASPVRYSRLHQIPTVASRDDVSHKIVTPGGMVLDTPKMVAATDVLTIVARDPDAMCFRLLTFARDRHRCEVTGVARRHSEGAYLFRNDNIVVRFTFIDEHQVNVEPVGTGYRSRCEPSGEIERAIYHVEHASN